MALPRRGKFATSTDGDGVLALGVGNEVFLLEIHELDPLEGIR